MRRALGRVLRAAHHVGATSVPGLPAVPPVLDLVAEVETLEQLGPTRLRLLAHGFELAKNCPQDCQLYVVDDIITGERRVELRCYPAGHPEAAHAPAVFALLRARPDLAKAYHAAKRAARAEHGADETTYHTAKHAWLERLLDAALALERSAVD